MFRILTKIPYFFLLACSYILLFLTAILFYTFSNSQDLNWDKSKGFEVTFDIDNVYTSDGINWEMSISGQAGPYGMGFGTITFKNFSSNQTQGEYSGYFWTQVEEKFIKLLPLIMTLLEV